MEYVEMDLILFWIFFACLSALPLILARLTQGPLKDDKKDDQEDSR